MQPNHLAIESHRFPFRDRHFLFIALPAMILGWILFKCYYPYADFFSDSYTYIQAAADHDTISYRPIGYSFFLRLLHSLSASDTFLVTVQYGLVQSACLGLFFFLRRRCPLPRWAQLVLIAFFVLDPLVYYISNYVSSDALFIALSLFWFTALLRLLQRRDWRGLALQWILLILIFYTRYVALFYPAVAALAFLLVRRDLLYRVTAIAGSIALVVAAAGYTRQFTREQTGAPVFSAFSGWQIANNVLNGYPWLPADTTGLPSPACRELARYVDDYFKVAGPAIEGSSPVATTAYMWEASSPLHRYFDGYRQSDSFLRRPGGVPGRPGAFPQQSDTASLSYFVAWNRVAPLFTQYGYYLLRRHPGVFARHYLWPSAKSFFLPPLDVFAVYNEGKTEVDPIARRWFHYHSPRPKVTSATIQAQLLAPFPWLFLLSNLAFGIITCCCLANPRIRAGQPAFTLFLQLAAADLLAGAGFNIFASPSVLRYQVLPLILLFIFIVAGIGALQGRLFFLSYRSSNDKPVKP